MSGLTQTTEHTNVSKQVYSLGMIDSKKRIIGLFVRNFEVDFVPAPEGAAWGYRREPGHYFGTICQATRNHKTFGASQPDKIFATKDERDAHVMGRLQETANRYKKQRGVSVMGNRDLYRG